MATTRVRIRKIRHGLAALQRARVPKANPVLNALLQPKEFDMTGMRY